MSHFEAVSRPPYMNDPNAGPMAEDIAEAFQALRPRLVGVAYGLLGTLAEAEDAVQEAWVRLQGTDADGIEDLTGWLIATTSRIAIDVLRSARSRRESYVGPWLPEPVEIEPDPADSISLADSMSWAMLVVLETLSPAERAAFVLHDVFGLSFDEVGAALGRNSAACRKLASRARDHIEARKPRFDVDAEAHRDVVQAFAEASASGDFDALLRVLDPDAVLTADGGAAFRAARHPIEGAVKIARFLAGTTKHQATPAMRAIAVNHNPALVFIRDGEVDGVAVLGIAEGRVKTIDFIRNREKFHGLRTGAGPN